MVVVRFGAVQCGCITYYTNDCAAEKGGAGHEGTMSGFFVSLKSAPVGLVANNERNIVC